MALKLADYKTEVHNDWCPGCGDFGIVNAIQMALAEMGIHEIKLQCFPELGVLERLLILSILMVYTHYMEGF
jgi:2-oxoglutarate ferredoxin oxidoreductase subunit beta